MKKWMMLAAALVLLTGHDRPAAAILTRRTQIVRRWALDSFLCGAGRGYHWTEEAAASEADELLLSNIEGEMLDSYYPGLSEMLPSSWWRRRR